MPSVVEIWQLNRMRPCNLLCCSAFELTMAKLKIHEQAGSDPSQRAAAFEQIQPLDVSASRLCLHKAEAICIISTRPALL